MDMLSFAVRTAACALALSATPVSAHELKEQPHGAAALHVSQDEEHGAYLVDQEGMSLYLFEADVQGSDGSEPESRCHDRCETAWPPLLSEGKPEAHDELHPDMLGTIEREDGERQLTYNGWPLYYFSADMGPGQTRGHDIELNGGEWYLVTPEGEGVGEE